MKKIFFSILFLIMTILLYIYIDCIFMVKSQEQKKEYDAKNVDIIFIGTSRVAKSFSPMYIWNKYGIATYNFGTSGQAYQISYLLAKQAIEKYKVKIIVVDILDLQERLNRYSSKTRDGLSIFALKNRYDVMKTLFPENIYKESNVLNRYHTRWKELNVNDFYYPKYYKGLHDLTDDIFIQTIVEDKRKNTNSTIGEDTKKIVSDFIKLMNNTKSNIVFIKLPNMKDDIALDESFRLYADEQKITFLDYNKLFDEVKISNNTDFIENNHINIYGGYKVTDHLIPYLIEKYGITKHKNSIKYLQWDKDYIKYSRDINAGEIKELRDFNRWKNQAFYDNYTFMISSNGNVMNKLPQDIKKFLKSKGLNKYNTDKANMRYVAIIDDNKVFFEEISENPVEYKGRMKRKVNLLVKSDGNSIINVSGKPRSKNKYGLNMVVYDKVNKEVVDSVWIDPNKPNEIRR